MRRRDFLCALASAVITPLAAHAQQTMPVVGYLEVRGANDTPELLQAFRDGLKEAGLVEGENVTVIYRFADNHLDRLPELAADLVHRRVNVINTNGGVQPAQAAKQATGTIPITFTLAEDPVRLGLVASIARPGGNLTGVNFLSAELAAKRLELLRELVPKAVKMALLINPNGPVPEITQRDALAASQAMGLQMQVLRASTPREIDAAFETLAKDRPDALFVSTDPMFTTRRVQMVNLTLRHSLPTSYGNRLFATIGGLMTYGSDVAAAVRQSAFYAGRIAKGTRPEDLPVLQSTKVELVINMQTARTLGIAVPQSLQVAADELIE